MRVGKGSIWVGKGYDVAGQEMTPKNRHFEPNQPISRRSDFRIPDLFSDLPSYLPTKARDTPSYRVAFLAA